MTRSEFVAGLWVASPVMLLMSGACVDFVPTAFALVIGLAAWVTAAICFIKAMKSKPAPQRS